MNLNLKPIIDYIVYFSPLYPLIGIAWYLAIFGRVDRSGENKSTAHRISKKH